LSYLAQDLSVRQAENASFLFDASFCSLPLYFAMKGKHDYHMVNADAFINDVKTVVEQFAKDYDVVVFPESRYPFMRQITSNLPTIELRKCPKEEICLLASQAKGWRKLDLESAQRAWDEMGPTFQINKIKSNKRKDYVPHLFEKVNVEGKVLLIDDFIMSGHTIKAMAAAVNVEHYDTFGIFYQQQ